MSSGKETVVLKVFLFTDLVGSTDLKRRIGDVQGARAIRNHNEIFRKCLNRYGGIEQDHAGDGFFAIFDVPSAAVDCALAFQQGMADLKHERLRSRVGVHMGQVTMIASGTNPELIGFSIDTAARLMGLALGDQILLTQGAFDSVRQFITDAPDGSPVEWLAHGDYRLKGVEGAMPVFEVGIRGLSPLRPPPDSEKARRDVAPEDADSLGWRPGIGKEVPSRRHWNLTKKLGEGAFGEAWLVEHERSHVLRVFKFCFVPDRLRALKREVTLLRLLKNKLGDRPDIAHLLDWQLESPPYYLESEYAQEGDLPNWVERQIAANVEYASLEDIPLKTRLELVAQVAVALGEAHQVGVLHNDIKPSNILIANDAYGRPSIRLADFGIGLIANRDAVKEGMTDVTVATEMFADSMSSAAGTQIYMAPERLSGVQSTVQSDVYSLGVVLYQMVLGDLKRPLSFGWEREIQDDLLRGDIAECVDGVVSKRLSNAKDLGERLRDLDRRWQARRAAARAQKIRISLLLTAATLVVGLAVFAFSSWVGELAVNDLRSVVAAQVVEANDMVAHVAAGLIQAELIDAQRLVERAARNEGLLAALTEEKGEALQSLLDQLKQQDRSIFSLGITDAGGKFLRRSPREAGLEGRNFKYRDWFNGGKSSQLPVLTTHISEPFVSRAHGHEELVAVSTPVRDGQGKIIGVVYGSLSLARIKTLVEGAPTDAEGAGLEVVVVNDRNQLVVHPKNPLFTTREPGIPDMRWRIRASGSRSIHSWKQEAAIWWARSASRAARERVPRSGPSRF